MSRKDSINYDAHMNPVKNYRLPAKQFDKAIKQLNRFFK